MDHLPPELRERSARLNTQLRFGRVRAALIEAYKLRTFIQLKGARTEAESSELARVERVIAKLETHRTSAIQKLIRSIIATAKASLTPEIDNSQTLLDQFSDRVITDEDVSVASDADDENPEDHSLEKESGYDDPVTPPEAEAASDSAEELFKEAPLSPALPPQVKKPSVSASEDDTDWGWGPSS